MPALPSGCPWPFALCSSPIILARDAIHPRCRDVPRCVLRGRGQFNRRRRHLAHISGANLARSRSESSQRHKHSCTLAGIVRRVVWLSPRNERLLDDTHAARGHECRGWRIGRVAFDPYAFAYVRAARAILDLVRDDSLHAASANDALAAYALADNRIAGELVDNRDHRSILLFDVWRLFWSRQRDLDAGRDGFARLARHSPCERHQEFSGHLHQQRGGIGLFDYALGCVAPSAIHGGRRTARRLLRRPHCATRRSDIHPTRNRGYRIGDHDCDAVADGMKSYPQIPQITVIRKGRKPREGTRSTKDIRTPDPSSTNSLLRLLCLFVAKLSFCVICVICE